MINPRSDDPDCICKGNWRQLVSECEPLFGKMFVNERGERFRFFGLVHSEDDYYYGVYGKTGLQLLSCVGSLGAHGFVEEMDGPDV